MTIDFHIAGIPCQIRIDSYYHQKPMGVTAASDLDCYGYTEVEYTVLDRRGYAAPWLAKKITDDIDSEIRFAITKSMEE